MFCSKCGTAIADGSPFCHVCGAPQGSNVSAGAVAERTVTIKREGIFGTEPMSVFVDDGEYAIVRLGETKTFPITPGAHRLQVRAATHSIGKGGMKVGQGNKNSYSSDVIYIQATDGNLTFSIKMNMFGKMSLTKL